MKILVEHYLTYGKQDSETLFESCVIEDSKQERQGLLEYIVFDYCFDPEDFINGKSDSFYYSRDGGDWDEPTGGYLKVYSYENKLEELQKQFDKELGRLNKQFGKGE